MTLNIGDWMGRGNRRNNSVERRGECKKVEIGNEGREDSGKRRAQATVPC